MYKRQILGPQDLLIRVSAVTSYASTPTYQFTAKYLAANGSTISYIGANGSDSNPINLSSSGSAPFTLNDGVVEGLELLETPAFSVQYHPEAAAGPHDASYLFDQFVGLMTKTGATRA